MQFCTWPSSRDLNKSRVSTPPQQSNEGRWSYPPKADAIRAAHITNIAKERLGEVRSAMAAFSSMKGREITYVSGPVTSGGLLYKFMDAHQFATLKEAKTHPGYQTEVVGPNIERAESFTDNLSLSGAGRAVIAPTSFEKGFHALHHTDPVRWGQGEFMSMWGSLIEQKVTRLVLMDGWEQSNGSIEEYLIAVMKQMGFTKRHQIAIEDQRGNPLSLDKGLSMLLGALNDLRQRGLRSESLEKVIDALLEAEDLYHKDPHPEACLEPYHREEFLRLAKAFINKSAPIGR